MPLNNFEIGKCGNIAQASLHDQHPFLSQHFFFRWGKAEGGVNFFLFFSDSDLQIPGHQTLH